MVNKPASARRSGRPASGHEVVEQPAELALDVDVAVGAPDDPEPAVAASVGSRRGDAAGRSVIVMPAIRLAEGEPDESLARVVFGDQQRVLGDGAQVIDRPRSSETRVSPMPRSTARMVLGDGRPVRLPMRRYGRTINRPVPSAARSRSNWRPRSRPGTGRIPYGRSVGRVGQRHRRHPTAAFRPRRERAGAAPGPNPFWWNV